MLFSIKIGEILALRFLKMCIRDSSYDLTADQMGDWAACMGIEAVYIDKDTDIRRFRNELKWNEAYYKFH